MDKKTKVFFQADLKENLCFLLNFIWRLETCCYVLRFGGPD